MPNVPIWGLAGRRVDAPGAPARFPLARVGVVRDALRTLLADNGAETLVCSAACGADLVALQAARDLGLRRRIVLPFTAEAFRDTSVVDRPGDWGPLFDDLIGEARQTGDLLVLDGAPGDDRSYARANESILDDVLALTGKPERAAAAIAWEGRPRGEGDATHQFAESARRRGLPVFEVLTAS
jgi:hypothetical protein